MVAPLVLGVLTPTKEMVSPGSVSLASNVATEIPATWIGSTVTINLPTTYTLTYIAGEHGSISGDAIQTVAAGGDGSPVTAVADSGYRFVKWSDDSTDNPRTDTNVTANITVTAIFEAIETGDVNGDGEIDSLDITLTIRMIVGLDAATDAADVNGDGKINALDIAWIEMTILNSTSP